VPERVDKPQRAVVSYCEALGVHPGDPVQLDGTIERDATQTVLPGKPHSSVRTPHERRWKFGTTRIEAIKCRGTGYGRGRRRGEPSREQGKCDATSE
jgi:hypothetical protein